MAGLCEGRTLIVTGAGAGLGREYARALVAAGANVIVNDIRVDAARQLATELGPQALANGDDICAMDGARAIVAQAVHQFGDVHGVVNNAGIVRDRMFASLSEDDWDLVIKVHLKGHFCIASTLVQRWRDQVKASGQKASGRIINTSSGAGLQGSIGQSNYAAAKGGIASLTLVQAAELARYGVTANAIAPAARTGMTEAVFADTMKPPEQGFDFFDPANVAPLIVWLCSVHSAHVSGRVFEVAGGQISVADGWRSGRLRDNGARWQPAAIGAAIDELIAEAPPAQKVYGS